MTVQVVNLTATPATATNEPGSDNQHTVTATIAGDPSVVAGRLVSFVVGGNNAGAKGTCSPSVELQDQRGRSGQLHLHGAKGRLRASAPTRSRCLRYSGHRPATVTVTVAKIWRDTTPPVLKCMPSVNPDGKNIPGGSNEDGFYLLTATDTVTAQSNIVIKVNGIGRPNGSPFRSGDTIKYTQAADGKAPVSKTIGGPNSAVAAHVTSGGDAQRDRHRHLGQHRNSHLPGAETTEIEPPRNGHRTKGGAAMRGPSQQWRGWKTHLRSRRHRRAIAVLAGHVATTGHAVRSHRASRWWETCHGRGEFDPPTGPSSSTNETRRRVTARRAAEREGMSPDAPATMQCPASGDG